jgi:hypothetical protein
VKFCQFFKLFLVRRKLPFFGQNCSQPFSLRSLDIPALFLKKPWYPCPFEILAEAQYFHLHFSQNNTNGSLTACPETDRFHIHFTEENPQVSTNEVKHRMILVQSYLLESDASVKIGNHSAHSHGFFMRYPLWRRSLWAHEMVKGGNIFLIIPSQVFFHSGQQLVSVTL